MPPSWSKHSPRVVNHWLYNSIYDSITISFERGMQIFIRSESPLGQAK